MLESWRNEEVEDVVREASLREARPLRRSVLRLWASAEPKSHGANMTLGEGLRQQEEEAARLTALTLNSRLGLCSM